MFRPVSVVLVVGALCAGAMASSIIPEFTRDEVIWRPNEENISEVEQPVNELFPSAVLFGRTCGGTIISDRWILTAAHCTLFTQGRSILAGTNNTRNGSGVKKLVKRLIVHPRFSVGPYWLNAELYNISQVAARWDFMLAELEEPLPLDGKTMVAAKLDGTEIRPNLDVGYAGYGAEHHGETMRHEMHGMKLRTLPDEDCKKLVEYDSEDMLCTVGRKPRFDSACNGDSGSGLMYGDTLIGVASWVENDAIECRNGATVVFSRVPAVRDWIKHNTGI